MLITIEGLDGSGKTTLLNNLSRRMGFIRTKEPGSPHCELNKKLRELVLGRVNIAAVSRELLFYADAYQHKLFIERNADRLIISDRGKLSHLAYLYGYLKTKELDWDEYSTLKKMLRIVCATPDAVVYLQNSIATMRKRAKNKDAIEGLSDAYFNFVLSHYDDLIKDLGRLGHSVLLLSSVQPIDVLVQKVYAYSSDAFKAYQNED